MTKSIMVLVKDIKVTYISFFFTTLKLVPRYLLYDFLLSLPFYLAFINTLNIEHLLTRLTKEICTWIPFFNYVRKHLKIRKIRI